MVVRMVGRLPTGGVGYAPTTMPPQKGGNDFSSVYDLLPTPASLWSVARRLRRAYTGPVIRVRRSSDNVEQDFYGVGSSGIVFPAAIASFCGAGNGFLVTRYDQSGNARHATQATTTLQPIVCESGVPVVNSGGRLTMKHPAADARRLAVASSTAIYNFLHTTGGTVLAVSQANDTAASKIILANKNGETSQAGLYYYRSTSELAVFNTSKIDSAGVSTSGSSARLAATLGSTTANTVVVSEYRPASGSISAWQNGDIVPGTPTTDGSPFAENAAGNMTIGASATGSSAHDGTIGDVGIWSVFFSEAERKLVEADQGRFNSITVAP